MHEEKGGWRAAERCSWDWAEKKRRLQWEGGLVSPFGAAEVEDYSLG